MDANNSCTLSGVAPNKKGCDVWGKSHVRDGFRPYQSGTSFITNRAADDHTKQLT